MGYQTVFKYLLMLEVEGKVRREEKIEKHMRKIYWVIK